LPDFGHVWALFETDLIKFEIGLLKFDSSLRKLCPDRDGESIDAAYRLVARRLCAET
jgi:hypothetical protein